MIFTSFWSKPLTADHIRIGISRGSPRWMKGIQPRIAALAPGQWLYTVTDFEDFRSPLQPAALVPRRRRDLRRDRPLGRWPDPRVVLLLSLTDHRDRGDGILPSCSRIGLSGVSPGPYRRGARGARRSWRLPPAFAGRLPAPCRDGRCSDPARAVTVALTSAFEPNLLALGAFTMALNRYFDPASLALFASGR
jgi:hypothetical protein